MNVSDSKGADKIVFVRIIAILIVCSIFFPGRNLGAQIVTQRTHRALEAIYKFHYRGDQPLRSDDLFQIKKDFLAQLDPLGIYFTEKDISELGGIPLDLSTSRYPFFELTAKRFRERLVQSIGLINVLSQKPFDFSKDESYVFLAPGKVIYPENEQAKSEKLRRFLKFRVLNRLHINHHQNSTEQNSLLSREKDERIAIQKRELSVINSILHHKDGFDSVLSLVFVNCILRKYDPHTQLFSGNDKLRFEQTLSSQGMSYGLVFSKSPFGEIRIERVMPGGSAWRSLRVNKGDVVLKVVFPAMGNKSLDISDMDAMELEDSIHRENTSELIITVRKSNGKIDSIKLFKEKLRVEENLITSLILDGEEKVGYISLPAFYTDWSMNSELGCANDVAKEILKLKREKISGLIVDLRNNYGGSVKEARDLIGLFIDEGPILIEENRFQKPKVEKDPSRGTLYDGPLVILVNSQSASASEFFVSTMKDYNRAIIVGSNTFGKASAQILIPMSNQRNSDFLKVTTSLYFGLSGKTHQRTGVIPNIELPDFYLQTEKDFETSLPNKTIEKKASFESLKKIDIDSLEDNSDDRVSDSEQFKVIQDTGKRFRAFFLEERTFSLLPGLFQKQMNEMWTLYESYDQKMHKKSDAYIVKVHHYDEELSRMDVYRKELMNDVVKRIGEDVYIDETYRILIDHLR